MYKIESYLTPLIVDKISKFVKDFRSEDFQISLWNGEAALQNLELCFDALKDVPLPVEFISGHVIELTIIIPWSKILSEPINVVVNTIELILRVKDPSAEKGDVGNEKLAKPVKTANESSQGYIQIVVEKILSNISVDLRNIILKIIYENIVLSATIQNISLHSANEKWEKAFADFSITDLSLRKLAELNGFSICCDEMNNKNSKIEPTQEPLLQNFSAKARILRKYKGAASSVFLIHILCPLLEFNISSLHVQVATRLMALLDSFKAPKVNLIKTLSNISGIPERQEVASHGAMSYVSWAWGLVQNVFTSAISQPETDTGHYLNIGLLLEEFNINLKSAYIGSGKIHYTRVCRVTLKGLFSDTVFCENKWLTTQCGINSFVVKPLGTFKDIPDRYFISAIAGRHDDFYQDSLFATNPKIPRFTADLRNYLGKYDDFYILGKKCALWVDFVHVPSDPQGCLGKKNSEAILVRLSLFEFKLSSNPALFGCIKHFGEVLDSNFAESSGKGKVASRKFTELFEDLKKRLPLKDIIVPRGRIQFEINIEDQLTVKPL